MLPAPPVWIVPLAFLAWFGIARTLRLDRLVTLEGGRVASIDGLRGILALLVYAHHFALTRQFQTTQVWTLTLSPAWNLLGGVGVAVFFMITGFLFMEKIRRWRGGGAVVWFFAGRVVRLVPVYAATIVLVTALAYAIHDPAAPGSAGATLRALGRWATLEAGPLFGVPDTGRMIAYVAWSLKYEWLFYVALPLTAFLWAALGRRAWPILGVTAGWLVLARYPLTIPYLRMSTAFFAPFALGGCVALIRPDSRLAALGRGPAGLALAAVALAALFATQANAYAVASYLLLTLAFAPIALGNDVVGLLRMRAAQVLGLVSYDIYLLHGLVLYVAYGLLAPHALQAESAWIVALHLVGAGLVAILASLAMHRLVERPAQKAGARWLHSGRPARAAVAAVG